MGRSSMKPDVDQLGIGMGLLRDWRRQEGFNSADLAHFALVSPKEPL